MAAAPAADTIPVEALQKNSTADNELIEVVTKKFGERLSKVPPDTVTRFVRGYAHEEKREEVTLSNLENFLNLAEKFDMQNCPDQEWELEDECAKAWPCYLYGRDKQGHPVMYDLVGTVEAKTLTDCFKGKVEKLQQYRFRFHARVGRAKVQATQESGHLTYKHILVMDLSNFGMSSLAGELRSIVQAVLGQEQSLFPETLYKCILVNTPWSFRMGWKIISAFIDPLTYEKIKVCSGSYKTEMQKHIDVSQIPESFGGSGKWPVVLVQDAKTAFEAKSKAAETTTTEEVSAVVGEE